MGKVPWRREWQPTPAFLGFPGGSAGKESAYNVGDLGSIPGWGDPLEKGMATHSSILELPWWLSLGFPGGSGGKESACNVGDLSLIPGLGRSPGEGYVYPLQCDRLENSRGSQRIGHAERLSLPLLQRELRGFNCLKLNPDACPSKEVPSLRAQVTCAPTPRLATVNCSTACSLAPVPLALPSSVLSPDSGQGEPFKSNLCL